MNGRGVGAFVLVVDDHPLVRSGIRATVMLHDATAHVDEAGSASEALARIAIRRPDIVLLDVNLPGTNGLDLARRLHAADRKLKVLIVAGEVDPWTVNEALEAGASGYVAKTGAPATLAAALGAILGGGVFLSPEAQAALRRADACSTVAAPMPGPGVLSAREREILRYLAHGENTKTIAAALDISPKTVETHRQHITRKLGTNNVAALVRYAIRHGLVLS